MAWSRHRLGIDGQGVTTLVAAWGCPLRCKFCLNRQCWQSDSLNPVTPMQLYDMVKVDDLYFQATGGGITFGGGEPLTHAPFIAAFRAIYGHRWRITAETSLHISPELLNTAMACVDEFVVDVKDMNPAIYRRYTGRGNEQVISNIAALLRQVGPDSVLFRVPLIPGYNTRADVDRSVTQLRRMGATRFDLFTYRIDTTDHHGA